MGCVAVKAEHSPGYVQGSGAEIASLKAIGAGCPVGNRAKLVLAGDPIDVHVSCAEAGGNVTIKLNAHGATFEEERYKKTADSFFLVDAALSVFDPPLLLAKVPMHSGDKWTWTGQMSSGGVAHPASAAITTSTERVFPPNAGAVDALKVVVDLQIDGGGPTPAKRQLSFWFAQNQGLIKRQFGTTSTREPAGP